MNTMRTIRLALVVFAMSICAAAQSTDQSQPTAPAPAFGQNAPVLNPDNPPVTGLDVPSLDLRTAMRSFVAPALQVSESGDSNGANQLGRTGAESTTRVIGALDLQKFWAKSDLFLEYLGGGAFYSSPFDARQVQALGLEGVSRWRTGQVTVRDSFSYLPDGSFQFGFGGDPGLGLLTGGLGTGEPGLRSANADTGGVLNIPRLSNTAILDAVQALNPRSAITLAGGFSNAHFYDPTDSLINSDQITVQGGYSHLLNRRDQLGIVYAFQLFQFPQASGGEIYTDVVNLRWSHTITGRLSLVVGAGPEYTDIKNFGQTDISWTVSARVQLHYKIGRSSLMASYEKYDAPGSGLFAGANVQAARVGYTHPVGRTWEAYLDADYSHSKKLENLSPLIGASVATSYNSESAGIVLRKHLGRSYDFFGAYRFTELSFNTAVCLPEGGCGKTAQRNIGTIGLEWHPKPTRLE